MKPKIIDRIKTMDGNVKEIYAPTNNLIKPKSLVKYATYNVEYKLGNGIDMVSGRFRRITDSTKSIVLYGNRIEIVIPIQNILSCELAVPNNII